MKDLTVLYVTANEISDYFGNNMRQYLLDAINGAPIISISKKPMDFGENIVTAGVRSHMGIYRDALLGAKRIKTKYMAFVEDDTLYSSLHFKKRSSPGKFAYNVGVWGLYTWHKPVLFNYKGRRNNNGLICETALYIEAMEERFAKYPDESKINLSCWAEPGKYEKQLGVTPRETEMFYTDPPNIMFSHPEGLSMGNLGYRKRLGGIRAIEIPHWGRAEDILKLYEE